MVSQITKGVKITVTPHYLGSKSHFSGLLNYFTYEIRIENRGDIEVQLLRRFWLIKDTLNFAETVEGEGVVGKTPLLKPKEDFTYSSGSFIKGELGSMQGFFTMMNINTQELFHVHIPLFCLNVPSILN